MDDNLRVLSDINANISLDLRTIANFLTNDDDWPNPYLHINLDSYFHDTESFVHKFKNQKNPLFLSINVQSLLSKHSSLSNFLTNLLENNVPISVVAIQEVWQLHFPELVNVPGFKFVHIPRTAGRGGGVGFYINANLSYNVIQPVPFVNSQFEYICIDVMISNKRYILCNIYRAPSNVDGDSLRDLVELYNSRLDNLVSNLNQYTNYNKNCSIIILSDCNINLLKLDSSPLACEYLDTCHTNGLLLTNFKASRVQGESKSLIDHIFTSNFNDNIVSGSILCDISDHLPIFYSCSNSTLNHKHSATRSRNFSHANMTRFKESSRNLNWNNVLTRPQSSSSSS
jgi:hypothetical protein